MLQPTRVYRRHIEKIFCNPCIHKTTLVARDSTNMLDLHKRGMVLILYRFPT